MIHAGIQLEVTALRIARWLLHLHLYTHSQTVSESLWWDRSKAKWMVERAKMMLMIITMTVMMEYGKFSPGIPTYIASGSADPSLTSIFSSRSPVK